MCIVYCVLRIVCCIAYAVVVVVVVVVILLAGLYLPGRRNHLGTLGTLGEKSRCRQPGAQGGPVLLVRDIAVL